MYSFSTAILKVKLGEKMTRKSWNGEGQYIELGQNVRCTNAHDEEVSCDQAIVFHGTSGVQIGWLASQGDMLADDWVEA